MPHDSTRRSISWGSVFKRAVKPLLVLIVAAGIVQAVRLAYLDLTRTQAKALDRIAVLEKELSTADDSRKASLQSEIDAVRSSLFSFSNVRWWLVVSAVPLACASILPPGCFWWLTLRQFGHRVPYLPTQSAYSVGGLGKYVPGKAMVLVLRSRAMQSWGVPISTSILSIFIETLMALAAGGGLGTLALTSLDIPRWLRWTLIITACVSLVPILPPIFRRVMSILSRSKHLRFPAKISEAMTWRFVAGGWWLSLAGQLVLGLALWLVCWAVYRADASALNGQAVVEWTDLRMLVVCLAATSMGFVIGFLSMLPGGAGARELVVTVVLAPVLGYAPALAAAVLFRIVNLLGDHLAAGLLWWLGRSSPPPNAST